MNKPSSSQDAANPRRGDSRTAPTKNTEPTPLPDTTAAHTPAPRRSWLRRIPWRTVLIALACIAAIAYIFSLIANDYPRITSIPAAQAGQPLVIYGSGFGGSPDQSRVYLEQDSLPPTQLQVLAWGQTGISAGLPAGVTEGRVLVERPSLFGLRRSPAAYFVSRSAGLPSQPNGYDVPVQPESPWPTFRRDSRNSARSTLPAVYAGDQPWFFQTGKGIFSTPVIDRHGVLYVGSADHYFYAINSDGSLNWKYETGEIIDSAGALGPVLPENASEPEAITFISGDGKMYHFATGDGYASAQERRLWVYQAELRPGVSYNRWFEGNVAVGPDGTLYAGNTNFLYYAINPDGTLKWTYETGSNNWSQAAFGADGSIFWGSNDTYVRGVAPNGVEKWNRMTLGFIAASAAVGSDGKVYIGSFDSNLYALDPATGEVRWQFPTRDHIYASAALGQGADGQTNALYFGSTDGLFYAVRPDGSLLWSFNAGDPIRSSAVIGLAPDGSEIVYFGCGNGRLYALNTADGSLRWSYDTTSDEPELRDRNDLNGSPALGQTGVYIGGEHGQVWYLPYDYCLNQPDPRCATASTTAQTPADATRLTYITPGGSSADFPASLPPATLITLRLDVTAGGQSVGARVCGNPLGCPKDALVISADPGFTFSVEHSADGRYIYIIPDGFLPAGETVKLSVQGRYYTGGSRLGNLTIGGREAGRFAQQFSFKVEPFSAAVPLAVTPERTAAFEWTRLALPIPTMLPSLNQIGFDYLDWIIGAAVVEPPDAGGESRALLWAMGAQRDAAGVLAADPDSEFLLPLSGVLRGGSFIVTNRDFSMPVTGIPIKFNRFMLRGQFDDTLTVQPGAVTYADTDVLSIPTFGPYLVVAGLANNVYQKLLVTGTYVTRPYPPEAPAAQAPQGISVTGVSYNAPTGDKPGSVDVTFQLEPGAAYPLDQHRPAILLYDPERLTAISLDYANAITAQPGPDGSLASLHLEIPTKTPLPEKLTALVMLDVYPFYSQDLP